MRPGWMRALAPWRWVLSWLGPLFLGWGRRATYIWGGDSLRVGERPEDLRFVCTLLRDEPGARIEALSISGFYPPGSAGNEHAQAMREWIAGIVRENHPNAILLDLTGLEYVWGDALAGVAHPLVTGLDRPLPVAWLANGRTARALEWFFVTPILSPLGMRLFQDRGEALRFLDEQLAGVRP